MSQRLGNVVVTPGGPQGSLRFNMLGLPTLRKPNNTHQWVNEAIPKPVRPSPFVEAARV